MNFCRYPYACRGRRGSRSSLADPSFLPDSLGLGQFGGFACDLDADFKLSYVAPDAPFGILLFCYFSSNMPGGAPWAEAQFRHSRLLCGETGRACRGFAR